MACTSGGLSLLLALEIAPRRGRRPQLQKELRALIRQMSVENPLWGAPRIHGELLKLGFEISQSSVAKYMIKREVTEPGLAHLSAQSCPRYRRDGFVHRPDHQL